MPARTLIVVYAKDVEKVAAFYSAVLSMPALDRDQRFRIVGDADMQIAVVRMADRYASEIEIGVQPRLREETPLKPSFLVEDLAAAREAALAAGGGTRPVASAWRWRGELHLDGFDPEGNGVQFRAPEP